MPQIELKHPDASHSIRVPESQKQHFQRLGWTPVETSKQPVKQPVKGQKNGKS